MIGREKEERDKEERTEREREKKRERWKRDFLSAGLLPQYLQQPRLGQAKARSIEISLPHGWQGSNHLRC